MEEIPIICFYHSRDLDGWMSAAIVKMRFPNAILRGWDYGQQKPFIGLPEIYDAIVCDICFAPEEMHDLEKKHNLVWLDHHQSQILISKDSGFDKARGIRDIHFAACELTWQFFYPDRETPLMVWLLGRYDSFNHKGDPNQDMILHFQFGARAALHNPFDCQKLLNLSLINESGQVEHTNDQHEVLFPIIVRGQAIYQGYLVPESREIYSKKTEINFLGYKAGYVNRERFNPSNFGIDYHNDGYDIFICSWQLPSGRFAFSVYNENGKVDVGELVKPLGGGGHTGASGFVASEPLRGPSVTINDFALNNSQVQSCFDCKKNNVCIIFEHVIREIPGVMDVDSELYSPLYSRISKAIGSACIYFLSNESSKSLTDGKSE